MNLQPILEDDLIVLKPLSKEHFESLYEVAKDPLIWEQHPCFDRYKKEVFTEFFADSIKSKGAFVIIDKANGKVIGSTRYRMLREDGKAVEIGWSFLSRDKWGGKYNKSMKNLLIDYALNFVDDVILFVDKNNIRSQKAIQKIGGIRAVEPYVMQNVKDKEDDWVYRISKKDR